MKNKGEIVVYQPDEITRLEVMVENETVWLTQKHNSQYDPITISQTRNIHDRFLIIDDDMYHIGASLKDLGKKLFAFSKMNIDVSIVYSK